MFRFLNLALSFALLATPLGADSLGQTAQKEKERREKEGKATKVLTEEDLKNAKGTTFSVTGAQAQTARKTDARRATPAQAKSQQGSLDWDQLYARYKKSYDFKRAEIEILTRVSAKCSPGQTLAEYDMNGHLVTWKCDEIAAQREGAERKLVELQEDLEQEARRRGMAPGRADLQ